MRTDFVRDLLLYGSAQFRSPELAVWLAIRVHDHLQSVTLYICTAVRHERFDVLHIRHNHSHEYEEPTSDNHRNVNPANGSKHFGNILYSWFRAS